jgi:DNA repair protein RecO (recombination protein O)
MLHTTEAIVLKTIRHGDRSVVMKCFTASHGMRSYVARISRTKSQGMAMFQPLNRLELVATEDPEKDLNNVREMRVARPYTRIPFDPVRGTLALFVQEVLYKILRGESSDPHLFEFVQHALEVMDTAPDVRNFPLVFLIRLSGHLGFLPEPPLDGEDHFDLKEGGFIHGSAPHGHAMGPPLSTALALLLDARLDDPTPVRIPLEHRRQLLERLLLYYRLHLEGMGELRSPAVLYQVLS